MNLPIDVADLIATSSQPVDNGAIQQTADVHTDAANRSRPLNTTDDENEWDADEEIEKCHRRAVDAAFELAMAVRCFTAAADSTDQIVRNWLLDRMHNELPKLASAVIEQLVEAERIAYGDLTGIW